MATVIEVERPSDGLAVLQMADRENSNLFTRQLVTELLGAFTELGQDPALRAVVVHGYDAIFCTGGTQAELLGIFEGQIQFDDLPLYRLFLDCPVPVVAAMQGHALGGGLVTGLFADLVVLAEQSLYSANFMKYGFTPGMGATLVLPAKLGQPLATELLLTAGGYHGGTLRDRGVPFPVLPRAEVVGHAVALARQLTDKPRESLVLLKRQLNAELVARLPATVEAEREMHRQSFSRPEVRERIETLFGESG